MATGGHAACCHVTHLSVLAAEYRYIYMLGPPPVTHLLAVSEHHLNAEEPIEKQCLLFLYCFSIVSLLIENNRETIETQ